MCITFTWQYTSLSSTGSTKPHSMPLRSSKETQYVGRCIDTFTASKQVVISMLQTYQFIEGLVMDCTVDDSLHARYQTWKLKCENILEAKLAHLPDAIKYKILCRWSGEQGSKMYLAWCLEASEVSIAILWSKWEDISKTAIQGPQN